MSLWTYVTGSIRVTVPGRTQPEVQYILDTVLDHLPRVTGSERDMHIHVSREYGYSSSSSVDEYGMRTNNLVDSFGDRSRHSGWLKVQDHYIIAVEGHLRDRILSDTKSEFMKWLCRLAKRLIVDDVFIRIWDYGSQFIIDERDKFSEMFEEPSWSRSKYATGEPSWWEHLMWERHPNSDMPLMHVYKYCNSEETDKEIERREEWHNNLR